MPDDRLISVQICTYNRKEMLRRCLEAYFEMDYPVSDFEIVLVDDGSDDGTDRMVAELHSPCRITYIRKDHGGLSAARNVGIHNARSKIILFADDDILPDRMLLAEHMESHRSHPNSIIMGWVNHVESFDHIRKPSWTPADISTSSFWTSNVSVPKKTILDAGLFDEEFTEYGWEDIELGRRFRARGVTRKFNPKAIVYHCKPVWKASDLPGLIGRASASGRSAIIYYSKHSDLRARMSTGIFGPRIAINPLLRPTAKALESRLTKYAKGKLSILQRMSVRILLGYYYYESIGEAQSLVNGEL